MNYKLNIGNESYSVADVQIPSGVHFAPDPAGKPLSFVSPVQLRSGQRCVLQNEAGGFQLLVNACLGFTFSPQFFVSGVIATKEPAVVGAV